MTITLGPRQDGALKRLVFIGALVGAFLFALLHVSSWLYPTVLESWARNAIALEVQLRVQTELDGFASSALGAAAGRMIAKNNQELAQAKAQMAQALPSRIAIVIEAMLDPDCACRDGIDAGKLKRMTRKAKMSENAILSETISKLDSANRKLTTLIESKYREVAQSLLDELRIFSAANAAVLLCLAITAAVWKRSALALLAPALVLVGAAAITATLYLFSQDWLQTILLGDYVGLWYFPYLGIALAFMLDVVFNRARIIAKLIEGAANAAGGVLSAGC